MPENKIDSAVIGKYCIVRGDRFGVLAGTVEAVDGETTVSDFIELTKNAYNGSVIRNLAKAYK